jgi:hypothetical protein
MAKSGHKGICHYRKGNYNRWLATYVEKGTKKAKSFPYNEEGLQEAIAWRDENCERVRSGIIKKADVFNWNWNK